VHDLPARLAGVRDRIASAAGRAGRSPSSVRLIAISKTFPESAVREAAAAGQIDFGENKVQEALGKIAGTADLPLRWHLVGHLQSNKARKAAGAFHAVHSVDDVALLKKLDESAAAERRAIDVLVQVDLAGEATKHGVPPEQVAPIFEAGAACRAARVCGFMLLPPAVDNPDDARPYFRAVCKLRDQLVAGGVNPAMLRELSMGMSHDFEVAVEEGATMVRVGSAIFGNR